MPRPRLEPPHAEGELAPRSRRRTRGGNGFEVAILAFERYELRTIVHQGEPWFMLHDLRVIADLQVNELHLDDRDVLTVDTAALTTGGGQGCLASLGGDVTFISEVGTAELCFRGQNMIAHELGRWVLRTAGPALYAAGLLETRAGSLPLTTRYVRVDRPEIDVRPERHVLYRFFDGAGRLLYVGISKDARQRMNGHRAGAQWWDNAARIEFERYPDRESAREAERLAIQDERPLHNIAS